MLKVAVLFFSAASIVSAYAADLKMGDPAPPIKVAKYFKGSPVNLTDGRLHVVEFWATWCGPCKANIPHLSEIQKKYQGKVVVVGVSVWERAADKVKQAEDFVRSKEEVMAYTVAADDNDEMGNRWMRAAGLNGIPASFLIDAKGKILWIGHPFYLDSVIEKVLNGTYTIDGELKEREARAAAETAKKGRLANLLRPVEAEKDKALSAQMMWDVMKANPEFNPELSFRVFRAFVSVDEAKAYGYAREYVMSKPQGEATFVVNALMHMLDPRMAKQPDYALAVELAKHAMAHDESGKKYLGPSLAKAYFLNGDRENAVKAQEEAIRTFKSDPMTEAESIATMEAELARYRAVSDK